LIVHIIQFYEVIRGLGRAVLARTANSQSDVPT
jgi:hypothetical protein